MKITANQVTLLRLVLLPLPVVMLYQGTTSWLLAAFGIFVLLGLTDAVDGMLARRQGVTALGALLDPVVDKIFLVAAMLPMVDLNVMPEWPVAAVFIRELGVTVLRSLALLEGFDFKTSRLAKLKTTMQMAGTGFILLIWMYPDDPTIRVILGICFAGSLVPGAITLWRRQRPGWFSLWSAGLIGAIAAARLLFPAAAAIRMILVGIVAITVWTGIEYAWGMRDVLRRRFAQHPLDALRLVLLSLVVPLLYLPVLGVPRLLSHLVQGVLAAELALGGLDNSLAQAGRVRGPWGDVARAVCQGLLAIPVLRLAEPGRSATVLFGLALALTVGELIVRGARNRAVFR